MRLRNPLPEEVRAVYRTYAAHPEAKYIISETDAAVLYNQVRKYRPTHCVELGSGLGTATAIIAMAMNANGRGKVTALEQLEWMAALAWDIFPDACKARVEIVRADPEVRRYFGEEWSCYQFTPAAADIDFVIVDGPAPWPNERGEAIERPNGDLIGLLPYLKPGCRVVIDGRWSTVAAYRRHLAREFRFRENRHLGLTLMELVKPVRG